MAKAFLKILLVGLFLSPMNGEALYKNFTINGQLIEKWVKLEGIMIFDYLGNKTYEKDKSGFETWWDYDHKGNLIYEKKAYKNQVQESYNEYNGEGRLIYNKDPYGYETHYIYKDNGIVIEKYADGLESHIELDKNGRETHITSYDGSQCFYKYDNHGNLIYEKDFEGDEFWYKYDNHNNITSLKSLSGREVYASYQYNENGNIIHQQIANDKGFVWINEEIFNDYNDHYDVVHKVTRNDMDYRENYYDYEYYDNGKIKKVISYSTLW